MPVANTVYTKWAGLCLNRGSSPLQHRNGLMGLKPAIAHVCIYPSVVVHTIHLTNKTQKPCNDFVSGKQSREWNFTD